MTSLRILGGLFTAGEWLLSALWKLVGGFFDWLRADFRHVAISTLVSTLGWAMLVTVPTLRADLATATARADREARNADDWMASAGAWEAELNAFVEDIVAKQAAAAEADRANAARVDAEFAALNERTVDDYEARLARSRAAAVRLRNDLARAETRPASKGGSVGGGADGAEDYTARCAAFGAADCDGLLRSLPGILAEAQINTDKLLGLQHYVAGSTLIDFQGEPEGAGE